MRLDSWDMDFLGGSPSLSCSQLLCGNGPIFLVNHVWHWNLVSRDAAEQKGEVADAIHSVNSQQRTRKGSLSRLCPEKAAMDYTSKPGKGFSGWNLLTPNGSGGTYRCNIK